MKSLEFIVLNLSNAMRQLTLTFPGKVISFRLSGMLNVDTVIFKNFSQKENLTKQKDLSDKAGIYQQSSPCLSSC